MVDIPPSPHISFPYVFTRILVVTRTTRTIIQEEAEACLGLQRSTEVCRMSQAEGGPGQKLIGGHGKKLINAETESFLMAPGSQVTFSQDNAAVPGDIDGGDTGQASGAVGGVGKANGRGVGGGGGEGGVGGNGVVNGGLLQEPPEPVMHVVPQRVQHSVGLFRNYQQV